jgi:hypothetical protein
MRIAFDAMALVNVIDSREILLKRCRPSMDTATTAPFGMECCSGSRISDSGTLAHGRFNRNDLEKLGSGALTKPREMTRRNP